VSGSRAGLALAQPPEPHVQVGPHRHSSIGQIRAYQDRVAAAVARFEGHIAKYMCDGVLAYFGWPKAHQDEAEPAEMLQKSEPGTECAGSTAREKTGQKRKETAADRTMEVNSSVPTRIVGGGDGIRTHDTAYHRITV
jgi:class 3 adenylate cyclase